MKNYIRNAAAIFFGVFVLSACAGGGTTTPTPGGAPAPGADPVAEVADSVHTINFAHVVSIHTPKGAEIEMFRDMMYERTNGRVIVNVFPNGQMGNDREITEQMLVNTIQMNAPLTSVLPFLIPEFEFFDLPYLFGSPEIAYDAVHGAIGDMFDELFAEVGFVGLGYWFGGFKQIANSQNPAYTVEDLAGLRMRVSASPILLTQFEAVSNATFIPFPEVYAALQSGVVDGVENPLANIVTQSFYEVANYLSVTDHGIMLFPIVITYAAYNELPADLREIMHEVLLEIQADQWQTAIDYEISLLDYLAEAGVQIAHWDQTERDRLFTAMYASYEQFREMQGGVELLEILENYRP